MGLMYAFPVYICLKRFHYIFSSLLTDRADGQLRRLLMGCACIPTDEMAGVENGWEMSCQARAFACIET